MDRIPPPLTKTKVKQWLWKKFTIHTQYVFNIYISETRNYIFNVAEKKLEEGLFCVILCMCIYFFFVKYISYTYLSIYPYKKTYKGSDSKFCSESNQLCIYSSLSLGTGRTKDSQKYYRTIPVPYLGQGSGSGARGPPRLRAKPEARHLRYVGYTQLTMICAAITAVRDVFIERYKSKCYKTWHS